MNEREFHKIKECYAIDGDLMTDAREFLVSAPEDIWALIDEVERLRTMIRDLLLRYHLNEDVLSRLMEIARELDE